MKSCEQRCRHCRRFLSATGRPGRRGHLRRLEKAGISLFLACLLASLTLLQLILIRAAASEMEEEKLLNALRQTPEMGLSAYDPDLYRRFGLWGLSQEGLRQRESILEEEGYWRSLPAIQRHQFKLREDILNPDRLEEQISAFMRLRTPSLALGRLARFFRAREEAAAMPVHEFALSRLRETGRASGTEWEILSGLGRSDGPFQLGNLLDEIPDLDDKDAAQTVLGELLAVPVPEESRFDAVLDYQNEERAGELSLRKLSAALSSLTTASDQPLERDLAVILYLSNMIPSRIHRSKLPADYPNLESLRGEDMGRLLESENVTLEGILWNSDSPSDQELWTRLTMTAVRSLCNFMDAEMDETRKEKRRAVAAAVAAAVSVISQGAIHIQPENLMHVILFAESLKKGLRDYEKLASGQAVPFFEQEGLLHVATYYHDYLTLFLAMKGRSSRLQGLAKAVRASFPDPSYACLSLEVDWVNPESPLRRKQNFQVERWYAVFQRRDGERSQRR